MSDVCHHHYLYHAQKFPGPRTAHLSLAGFAHGIAWAKRDGRWCAIAGLEEWRQASPAPTLSP
jgi:hypothetical protein